MALDYSTVDLESLAAKPLRCNCDDGRKAFALKQMILDLFKQGKVTKIKVGAFEWRLARVVHKGDE